MILSSFPLRLGQSSELEAGSVVIVSFGHSTG